MAIADGARWRERHSAQAEVDRLAEASVYMFDVPPPRKLAPIAIAVSFLLGLYFYPFTPGRWYLDWPLYSVVFFAAPALLSALFCHAYLRLIGAKSYLYRTMLLALVNLFIVGVLLVPGKLVEVYFELPRAAVLLFAYSTLVLINHLGFLMTATGRWVLMLPATLAQPIAGYLPILFAYYYSGGGLFAPWELPVLSGIFIVAFLGGAQVAMYIGTRPIKLAYGVNGVDIFRAFMDHWVEGGDAGRRELEAFFGAFAEPVDAHIGMVRFRERGTHAPIATLVVPSVHPGPWGRLAASNLPERVAQALGGTAGGGGGEVLTLHGASDHDLNPISQEELGKVLRAVERAAAETAQYTTSVSPFLREPDGFDACAQAFGEAIVALHTSSPEPTDDVDGPTGYVIERHLEQEGARPGIFVDAHNCLAPGTGGVSFGTPKSRALATRLAAVGAKALRGRRPGLRAGAASAPMPKRSKGLGPMGVQALVVEAGGQRMAWVLLDGNNIVCGLREAVRDRLLRLVDECEILTSDNHVVNVLVGGFNPVGRTESEGDVVDLAVQAVEGALAHMRDAEVGAVRTEVGDVLVFGRGNTIRLSSAINSAVATSEGALAAAFALASAISAFATYLLGFTL